jgi:hypothetical protein
MCEGEGVLEEQDTGREQRRMQSNRNNSNCCHGWVKATIAQWFNRACRADAVNVATEQLPLRGPRRAIFCRLATVGRACGFV